MLMKYATALTVLLALVANPAYSGEPLTEARKKTLDSRLDHFREDMRGIETNVKFSFPNTAETLTIEKVQTIISSQMREIILKAGTELLSELTSKERKDLENETLDLRDPRSVILEISFKINLFKHEIYTQEQVLSAIDELVSDYQHVNSSNGNWYARFLESSYYIQKLETYQQIHSTEQEELEEIRANGSERGSR